ncbi:MAG: ABC transporter ATP-binding protein [Candidatus Altiarchaeales archaeon]|nr:MAG: ABC transporter ATP-binding protein [Candidatus Altiarchaeales archaeon]
MLTVKDLRLERDKREILHGIDLEVKKGEIHAVLGPNGAGKSSLAYALMGCRGYEPIAGKIIFNDVDITNLSITERAKLGITLAWQEPARFEGLTVNDYLSLGKKNDVKEALEMVNLNPERYLNRFIETLSGGERKRVELASIVTLKPKLAILDEPDSGIDFISLNDLLELMIKLKNDTTILLITHNEAVAAISDKATMLCDGYIVKDGTPSEVTKYFRDICRRCPSEKYSKVRLKHET